MSYMGISARKGRSGEMFPPVVAPSVFSPIVTPYVVGVVTAPLVVRILTPIVRGTVKATVGIYLEGKRAAAEAGAEVRGIAAEVGTAKGV